MRRCSKVLVAVAGLGLGLACGDRTPIDESATTNAEYDCAALPEPQIRQLDGPIASADVAFDDLGALVGGNTQDLFRATSASGPPALWVPAVANRAALRYLSDGRLAVTQEMFRRVLLLAPDGSSELLASDLTYPFGLAEGPDGAVYIGDQSRIVRVVPDSGEVEVWLETPDFISRWLSFDREDASVFVGGKSETIYRVPIAGSGAAGEPEAWGSLPLPEMPVGTDTGGTESGAEPPTETGTDTGTDTGGEDEPVALIDGIGVDGCGNVYVAEFYSRALYKFGPEGGEAEVFVQWEHWEYGHGLQWGSGVGEWSATALYLPQPYNDFNVIEVEIGVPRG